jgi:starch synthase
VLLVDGHPIRESPQVYSDDQSDARKFVYFSKAALEASHVLGWFPDLIHAQDWHAAAALAELELRRSLPAWKSVRSVLTIHNLPFQGAGAEAEMHAYGYDRPSDPRLPEWSQARPLPVGLVLADAIVAVSPTYAREVQTPEFGAGLDPVIRARADRVSGIRNGIDLSVWNPALDKELAVNFNADSLAQRRRNRTALRKELSLSVRGPQPLLTMITRLDRQKGVDLALSALRACADSAWDFVLLGSGDAALAAAAEDLVHDFPGRVRFHSSFNPGLARRLYASADMILLPSRYEPCGLAQMIAMRYGCVPIVRATGGLRDTVVDVDSPEGGTGFVFEGARPQDLESALRRALALYPRRRKWVQVQRRGMAQDFSWAGPAREYRQLYASLVSSAA